MQSHSKKSQMQEELRKESQQANLWTIHGQQYDLSSYIDRHPGGKTAINLGRGRDCSALFESYHPFTSAHKSLLKKHRVKTTLSSENESKDQCSGDYFYDTLKLRVSKVLKDNGVDPKSAGCASLGRVVYLCCVFFCLAVSSTYHAKVSQLHKCYLLGFFVLFSISRIVTNACLFFFFFHHHHHHQQQQQQQQK